MHKQRLKHTAMPTFYDFTPEELTAVIQYVENGDLTQMTQETLKKFNALHAALTNRLYKDMIQDKSKTNRLKNSVERLKAANEARYEAGVFSDTGLDSVDVAKMLLYHLQKKDVTVPYSEKMKITNSKIVLILFEMYASWLCSKKQRLFLEHPSATEYYVQFGNYKSQKIPAPQFWRVFKQKLHCSFVSDQEYEKLREKSRDVAGFARNAAEKYYSYNENVLCEYFTKTSAFINADKDHNNGKWGKDLSDADIYAWKIMEKTH